jgi:16S rRNA (guanine527-N7)-methyltransferase
MNTIKARTVEERWSIYEQNKTRFDHYLSLLKEWNRSVNLFARSNNIDILEDLLLPCIACTDNSLLTTGLSGIDLGSGGGFPGIVVAIARPDVTVLLTEKVRKKASFLTYVAREMQLTNTTVFYGDILSLPDNDNYDFITARYFSDAGNIFSFANSRLKPDGSMLLFKPDSAAVELESLEWSITDIIDVGNQRSLFKLKHDNSSYSESRTA